MAGGWVRTRPEVPVRMSLAAGFSVWVDAARRSSTGPGQRTTRFGAVPHLPGSPVWQRDSSSSTVLDYHLSMLHDAARMDSFRRAIDASVQPGDVVVDIGCGSGVLSFMACEAGA